MHLQNFSLPILALLLAAVSITQTNALSWEISQWTGSQCGGKLTRDHLMPDTPSVGSCPETGMSCVSFGDSHSFHSRRLPGGKYTTLYVYAYANTGCTGNFVSYAIRRDLSCMNVNTGGNVGSLGYRVSLCGPPGKRDGDGIEESFIEIGDEDVNEDGVVEIDV